MPSYRFGQDSQLVDKQLPSALANLSTRMSKTHLLNIREAYAGDRGVQTPHAGDYSLRRETQYGNYSASCLGLYVLYTTGLPTNVATIALY